MCEQKLLMMMNPIPIQPLPTGRGNIRRAIQSILHRIITLRMIPPPLPPRSTPSHPLSRRQRANYYHRQILKQSIEVEDILYKSARSTEEYNDRESLEIRVWDACQRRAGMMTHEREREWERERIQLQRNGQFQAQEQHIQIRGYSTSSSSGRGQMQQRDEIYRQQQLLPPIIHDPERAQRHQLVQRMIREQMESEAAMLRLVLAQGRARMEVGERWASGRRVWRRNSDRRLVRID
mmetsp:Transcript_4906/g.10102  ORF Transcript_4906/g.10102 Transcript_4906/m.10102 type:complete len:236 (+) Transcript_4906:41-748(+)